MSQEQVTETPSTRPTLSGLCFLVSVVASLVLMMSVVEPLPFWDTDPSSLPFSTNTGALALGGLNASFSGIGPAMCVVLCSIAVAGAIPRIVRTLSKPTRWQTASQLCLFAGILVIGYHALFRVGFDPDAARLGCAWIAGIVCGFAAWKVRGITRAIAVALVLGSIAFLTIHGLVQVLLSHPATIKDFEATRNQFFAAKGWAPDSSMAQIYERRLNQNEMSGWFGLSNVYATFAASMAMCFGALMVFRGKLAFREHTGQSIWVVLGLGLSLVALIGSHSKGGIGALVLATVLLAFTTKLRNRLVETSSFKRRLPMLLGGAAITLPLLGILARGIIGTSIGELSILFRWFYVSSATRIAGTHLPFGTGPDGFKQAYTLLGHPMSPEQVVSPHSVLFDLIATLGIAGAALCVVFGIAAILTGRNAVLEYAQSDSPQPELPAKPIVYSLLAMLGGACVASIIAQPAASIPIVVADAFEKLHNVSPDQSLLFGGAFVVVATVLATGIGWAGTTLLMRSPTAMGRSVAAGALVLIVHAQIEMTPVITSATPVFCIMLGLGAGRYSERATEDVPVQSLNRVSLLLVSTAALTVCLWCGVRSYRWETALTRAAESLLPISEMRSAMQEAGTRREAFDAVNSTAQLFGLTLSEGFEVMPEFQMDPDAWLAAYRAVQGLNTDASIDRAVALAPHHMPTRRIQIENLITTARAMGALPVARTLQPELINLIGERAVQAATMPTTDDADAQRLLAMVVSDPFLASDAIAGRDPVAEWMRATSKDPRSIETRQRVIEVLYAQLDTLPDARTVLIDQCEQLLELNKRMRLDPLRQLSETERLRVETLLSRLKSGN
ncbi:MAG: O-antigen ligase family protein [Phycisphaeraceae bacterium]|nr:O-antigen ligase family protein [Phycisphaerales bacterium]MCB9860498.1 O-antigen ligase family protein [Phycisphaeraceae bacterium]